MKHFLLLRHAQALNDAHHGDFYRTLSAQGHTQAKAVADFIIDNTIEIDAIIASSAVRTVQTATHIAQALHISPTAINMQKSLYESSTHNLLQHLSSIDDSHNCVLIVGHNPAVFELAVHFSDGVLHVPPATLLHFQSSAKHFADISLNNTTLVAQFHG